MKPSITYIPPRARLSQSGFSLVEVVVALGLVSYSLLALLGLFVIAMNSSMDSAMQTAATQIAMHVSNSGTTSGILNFNGSGAPLAANAPAVEKYYSANVTAQTPSQAATTSTNVQLVTIKITSPYRPGQTYTVHTTELLP